MHGSGSKRLMKIAAWRQAQLKTAVLAVKYAQGACESACSAFDATAREDYVMRS
jgi:hypothetical protein